MAFALMERPFVALLRLTLRMADADRKRWIMGTVAASIVLAALDTLGAAAMVPLTQLATGADTNTGILAWVSDVASTNDPSPLIPIVASAVAVLFIGKSIGAIVFRWWLLGRTTRVSALASAELARRYALAPYASHRTRRMSELHRNINDSTTQSASVLLGIVSICTYGLLLIAITATTAFVASSGAGKSTLLNLIHGLLTPTEGTVEVGGRSIHEDPAAWNSRLGVVPQEVFLLNDTLVANVAFLVSAERVDRACVEESIRMAEFGRLVADLPDGLDTVVGERGTRVSGGQRQRIGLASALYRRPNVLVLNEATSALDNLTEHEITTTLAECRGASRSSSSRTGSQRFATPTRSCSSLRVGSRPKATSTRSGGES